ncbi:hypothetical protein CcaCcLH18_08728 [Colletotrichum camelliae]|nr:hypothetical protein CcaCcLH18_08728 [Colletotrichum camelliae]
MSIARLQASLAQATNEVTVAAANINFDFCLVKYEAPKEYQPVAKFLSASRKQDAEQGKSHATARRLAALFEGTCPETKSLIKAYGQRVSEISKQATDQESKQYSASLFSSYVGIDATSIWAAATSSESEKPSAIQVHLLACMLAAMFEASKAISVWVELVDGQRKAIARSWENDESIPFSAAAAAAQQDISRAQLAEWDASARAWLQTADSVMNKKQTQLRLILKNIQLSMGTDLKVYPGVIEAWKKTLRTVDRLVAGIPQEVQDGSAILGLAAWHIYPDINVFGSRNVEVYMRDPLVAPGGVLSLGCSPSVSTSTSGVSWSLSLAQLRYYGQPVTTKGSFQPDPTRITFKELMLVTLGCLLSRWNVAASPEQIREAIQIVSLLSKSASSSVALAEHEAFSQSLDSKQSQNGAKLLFEATRDYFADRDTAMRFISLGQNRTQFLPAAGSRGSGETRGSSRLRPFFGLEIPGVLVSHLKDGGGRVELLRRMANRATGLEKHVCIIQYTEQRKRDETSFNYATGFSKSSEEYGASRTIKSPDSGHSRWLQPGFQRTVAGREAAYTNDGYSIYGPSGTVKLICTHKIGQKDESSLDFWYGDPDSAAIYVQWNSAWPRPPTPKVGRQDLLWCLEHDLLTPDVFSVNHTDNVSKTLNCLASASRGAFESISGPVIHVQVLGQPFVDATCMQPASNSGNPLDPNWRLSAFSRTVSILSYLVAGYDIPAAKIPGNIVGISMGDSIFVPQKVRSLVPFDPDLTSPINAYQATV